MHILVVEDEKKVAQALREGLEGERFSVTIARTGEEFSSLVNLESFDLVILDVMLSGKNSLEVLRALRERHVTLPVLILTARDSVENRVEGLEAGGDDYLIKPFAFPELVARVRALLRRGLKEPSVRFVVADLELDLLARTVQRGGMAIVLTTREMALLEYLMRHHETIVSREMIARDVWKESMRATSLDNVIDVHIAHLRKKIDDAFEPKLVHTVRGVGFLLGETRP